MNRHISTLTGLLGNPSDLNFVCSKTWYVQRLECTNQLMIKRHHLKKMKMSKNDITGKCQLDRVLCSSTDCGLTFIKPPDECHCEEFPLSESWAVFTLIKRSRWLMFMLWFVASGVFIHYCVKCTVVRGSSGIDPVCQIYTWHCITMTHRLHRKVHCLFFSVIWVDDVSMPYCFHQFPRTDGTY